MPEEPTAVELAEAKKFLAEAEQYKQEAAYRRINQASSRLHLDNMLDQDAFNKASDIEHQIYRFRGVVHDESVSACVQYLTRWSRLNPGSEMTVVFNSPGGSVH